MQQIMNIHRHPTSHMIVQSVQVYGLFGEFDYRLDFREGLNFVHSPNGYGKSTLMHMVYSALRGDLGYLKETPFQRLDIIFSDGSAMIIEKDGDMLVQMQKNELESAVGPDEMSSVCKCLYIGPERTVIKKGDGHLVPALEAYAKELSETLRSAKEHTELVDTDGSRLAEMSDAQLEGLSKDIKARMEFLADAGFVPKIPGGYRFPPSRYELSEYRDDYIRIIAGLDEYTSRNRLLAESVVVFKDIVNDLFVNKTLTISDTGKIVVAMDNGAAVQLSKLSSGEKQVMILVYNLLFHCPPGTLAIIDEPEISLHVSWQQKLSTYFSDICRIRGIQMIVATHSPQIIHDKWDLAVELRPSDARIPLGRGHRQPDLHAQIYLQRGRPCGGGVI
ncbi:MAG: ATP-binding protein [Thermoplasmata archaeon]|nr:ATP-binding protein [Thermoplasmata archaeon]